MASHGWKLWVAPLTLWALYSCWYCGYQSGYADGHETAWSLSRPFESQFEVTQAESHSIPSVPASMPVTSRH